MNIEKVQLKKLLSENTLTVCFNKKDGTQRTMLCTLMPEHLPVVDRQEGDEVKEPKKQSDGSLPVWDLEKKAWRAFRLDSIVSYSISSL
ncbi:DUF2693 domain-containing protein [bacterium]|nr:DUF2693 domain-containing protein [bacterium]